MQETWVWSLGLEDSLEQGTATHSSILAWRTPWTEEPSRLYTAHSVIKSRTKLRDWHFTSYSYYKQGRETIGKIFPAPPRMGKLSTSSPEVLHGRQKQSRQELKESFLLLLLLPTTHTLRLFQWHQYQLWGTQSYKEWLIDIGNYQNKCLIHKCSSIHTILYVLFFQDKTGSSTMI